MQDYLVKIKNLFLIIFSVLVTLFVYRSIFSNNLLGDSFDGRLQIILHEHWWSWFKGQTTFRDTGFFFPFDKALGFSDVFLLQGIIYSAFRLITLDIPTSWTFTTILVVILGNLGWVFVAKKFIQNYLFKILFILTIISSLSFVNYFTLNANASGYTLISWLVLLYYSALKEKDLFKKNLKYYFLILFIILYTLTCWYGAFFVVFTFCIKKLFDLFFRENYYKLQVKKVNIKLLGIFLPFYLFFIWLFIYVYYPTINEADRTRNELIKGSPSLQFLPNGGGLPGTNLNGAIFSNIYEKLNLNIDREYAFGIGLFVFVFALIYGFQFFLKNYKNYSKIIWPISIIFTYFIFILLGDTFSLFSILFNYVPGFNSIRYPSRYVIFLGYLLIFLVFYQLDKLYYSSRNLTTKISISIILLITMLDQIRMPFTGWNRDLLINKELFAQSQEIKEKCDYFYFDYPGGWWFDQIEAMTFSMQIDVPTVNGYSGGFPKDYPTEPFLSEKMPLNIFDWINDIPPNLKGCFVTGKGPVHAFSPDLISIDFVGFTNEERNRSDSWNWAVTKNPYLYVINLSKKNLIINFEIKSSVCNTNTDFSIKDSNQREISKFEIQKNSMPIELILDFQKEIVKKIDFKNALVPCKIENDPRPLYFEVKNLSYTVL